MKHAAVIALGCCAAMGSADWVRAGDAEAGKAKAALCAGCHGASGEGKEVFPALRCQTEAYLIQSMQGFKSGERKEPTMNAMFKDMSDQDIENLAAYYAAMQ